MKRTRVALVSVVDSTYPPISLMYLAAYLEKHVEHVDVRIVDKAFDNIEKTLRTFEPDIVGISAMTPQYPAAVACAESIKRDRNIPVIVGGVHISVLPSTLKQCFDAAVIGEGEIALAELIACYRERGRLVPEDLGKLKGVCFWHDGALVTTERRPLMENLDVLPFIDYRHVSRSYLDEKFYYGRLLKMANVFSSRGCPFKCPYCSSANFWCYKVRMHSPEYVAEQIMSHIARHGVRHIETLDDFFAINVSRAQGFVDAFRKAGILGKISLAIQTRVDCISDEMCDLFKQLNVISANFGFESGSERVLKHLKVNTTTPDKNMRAIEMFVKHGMIPAGGFMFGSPGEKIEDMMDSYEFMKKAKGIGTSVMTSVTTPFPGTQFWEIAKERGTVTDDMDFSMLNVFDASNPRLLDPDVDRNEFARIYREATALNVITTGSMLRDLVLRNPLRTARLVLTNPRFHIKKMLRFLRRK